MPLVVGITGHRDLNPWGIDCLRRQVRGEFEQLLEEYPHTPLLLLSTLGEGADRLVAEVAHEVGERIQLAAVLPRPRGAFDEVPYRGGDRSEFDRLLGRAGLVISIPLEEGGDGGDLESTRSGLQRQFAGVGRFLVQHSELLLAVWDGEQRDDSETWQVIRWLNEGMEGDPGSPAGYLDEPETGPVRHLPMARGDEQQAAEGEPAKWLYPAGFAKRFSEIAGNLERFNRDAAHQCCRLKERIDEAREQMFPPEVQNRLPPTVRFLLDRFALADCLAMHFQRYTNYLFAGVLVVIFLTVASFECYAHLAPGIVWLMVGYFLFFGGGTAAVFLARRNRLHRRYLDYRALAEALRVHLFWKLAGLKQNAADYYLRSYRSHLDWIRVALRSWAVQSGERNGRERQEAAPALDEESRFGLVRDHWIEAQRKFYDRRIPWNEAKHRHWRWVARLFLVGSLSLAAIQGVRLVYAAVNHGQVGHDQLTHVLIVGIALCGVMAGLTHEYAERRAFEKQARAYKSMASLYRRAGRSFDRLLAAGDHHGARRLLKDLGRDALAENSDWVIYHRERPPEMKAH